MVLKVGLAKELNETKRGGNGRDHIGDYEEIVAGVCFQKIDRCS